ncbi:MAG TPA: hypothetical protein EYG46_07370 [Myxococcales bacterium]|nr:hypothetical protein [Myxococcales bacterium]HIM00796.1 hypothetical protein [Myxococcales bacterium]
MFRPHTARKRDLADAPLRFALYVEGPRDRDVLRHFAQKLSPELAKTMDPCVRILGGKQPERAAQMFGRLVEEAGQKKRDKPRGLCILDRDDDERWNAKKTDDAQDAMSNDAANLEFVVWNRRQIESYLLVPHALRRCASKHGADTQFDRILASTLPDNGDEAAFASLNAKRLLSARGPIADYLGRPLRAREIVRNMSPVDIHDDVKAVLTRVRDYVGTRRNSVSTLVGQPA